MKFLAVIGGARENVGRAKIRKCPAKLRP
ncbi:uncharacterized protein METZ01_LOCUS387426 [marine metagenome]|uniref:Uncharacterized protein n=1 Tax=marine metagenome TaxID=408172 RepID=A0A382UK94_9ZZZZ